MNINGSWLERNTKPETRGNKIFIPTCWKMTGNHCWSLTPMREISCVYGIENVGKVCKKNQSKEKGHKNGRTTCQTHFLPSRTAFVLLIAWRASSQNLIYVTANQICHPIERRHQSNSAFFLPICGNEGFRWRTTYKYLDLHTPQVIIFDINKSYDEIYRPITIDQVKQ